MALSQENKYRIIFALCHTGKILVSTSTHYNSVIANRLENLDDYIEAQALALLDKIEAAKVLLESSPVKGNVKRIGDIELDTQMGIELKQKEVRRLQSELSNLLDIPNRCKVGGSMGCLVL